MSGLLNRRGPISRMVGGGIGLAKEYSADRKARKSGQSSPNPEATGDVQPSNANENPFQDPSASNLAPPPQYQEGHYSHSSADESESEDDEEWAQMLDEMSIPLQERHTTSAPMDPEQQAQAFLQAHPPPPYSPPQSAKLPLPVIIPQRRPESRHRGFVRAYAPLLKEVSIDQATWLSFLDGFEKAIKANPTFHVMNFGVFVAEHVHLAVSGFSPITMAVSMAVHVSIEAGRRGYLHYKQNGYLDKMNEEFFKPRGLYCLIIKYKPSKDEPPMEDVNIETNIAQQIDQHDDPERSKWKNLFSSSSGTTSHDSQIPEAAPLIFPEVENMNEGEKQNAIKQFGHFASDYFDRQAQATFHARNPNAPLPEAPRKEFASRYSDPNHPASQGGLISIATGGKVNPVGPLGRRRQRRAARRGEDPNNTQFLSQKRQQRRDNRPMRRLLKQDALYLMVVNLPSQEEMDKVAAVYEGRM